MTAEHHLDAEELVDYYSLTLDPAREQEIEEHVALCDTCAVEARRIYEMVSVAERSSARTVAAAYAAAHKPAQPITARAAEVIHKLIHTTHGWMEQIGEAVAPQAAHARIGDWSAREAFTPQGVSLAGRAKPLALAYPIRDVGTVTLQIMPRLDEDDWHIVARFSDAHVESIVVGLGDETQARFGKRTVTTKKDQIFHLTRSQIHLLQVHLAWRKAESGIERRVVALPVDTES